MRFAGRFSIFLESVVHTRVLRPPFMRATEIVLKGKKEFAKCISVELFVQTVGSKDWGIFGAVDRGGEIQ